MRNINVYSEIFGGKLPFKWYKYLAFNNLCVVFRTTNSLTTRSIYTRSTEIAFIRFKMRWWHPTIYDNAIQTFEPLNLVVWTKYIYFQLWHYQSVMHMYFDFKMNFFSRLWFNSCDLYATSFCIKNPNRPISTKAILALTFYALYKIH